MLLLGFKSLQILVKSNEADAYECESNILQKNPQLWCTVGNELVICLIMGLDLIEIPFFLVSQRYHLG